MTNFGLDPEATCFFEVEIARTGVTIFENYDRPQAKATIPYKVWSDIADMVKAEWNVRLKKYNQKTGRWSPKTRLDRLLGKELTLLVWALEDAPPEGIERAIANWKGLAPEERWWLYTTTNATSNRPDFGKDRGWRKAIRIALQEN